MPAEDGGTSLHGEISSLAVLLESPAKFYNEVLERSDPRVKDWLWMRSPLPTLVLIILYVAMVICGPRIMRNRPAFEFKPLLFVFNSAVVALYVYLSKEYIVGMIDAKYDLYCTPMVYSYHPTDLKDFEIAVHQAGKASKGIASALWWYYFSKFIEFFDTLFFILRKKNNQITFLHVYHHASMFFLWWIGVKWVAGGQSVQAALINSVVHVIMYSYYALSSLGPRVQQYLWWKRHITRLQLIQFAFVILHASHSIYIDCNFPKWMHYALIGYATSFIILFTNFYIHAYVKKSQNNKKRNLVEPKLNSDSISKQTSEDGRPPDGTTLPGATTKKVQ